MNYVMHIRYPGDVLPAKVLTFHHFHIAWALFKSIAPFAEHITLEAI